MATVARMPANNTSTEKNGKPPSFAAESNLFADSESVDSPNDRNNGNATNDWHKGERNRFSKTTGIISSGGCRQAVTSWQSHDGEGLSSYGNDANKPGSVSTPTLTATEESTRSLQEFFESDDMASPRQSFRNGQNDINSDGNDEWFNGDSDILGKGETKASTTPPLSLYASKIQDPQRGYHPSYPPVKRSNELSIESSGNVYTVSKGNTGSISSTKNNTPRNIENPILYSAIGSLENPNAISAESFKNRLQSTGKNFSALGAKSTLIPPANQLQKTSEVRTVAKDSSAPKNVTSRAISRSQVVPLVSANQTSARAKSPEELSKANLIKRDPETSEEAKDITQKPSNLRTIDDTRGSGKKKSKKVSYNKDGLPTKKPIEMFRPSCDAYTPRIEKKSIKYRAAEMRTPVQKMATPMGTLQRPNFRDALRRVAMIIHQHIVKIERRFEDSVVHKDNGLFKQSMKDLFAESNYCTPTYKCTMVRIPMARPGMVYGLKKMKTKQEIPSEEQIYEFGHQLFKSVQLSSECSIVCLIYVERLMETAKVPLLACTWRPIFMCGLLLASKVWQDLSSWNIEFASVYPQYSLDAINRLELNFLRMVKWDLYISSSLYAKYYFALRALVEKVSFRQRYNRMVGGVDSVAQSEALKIQKRTEQVKEEALLQLSRSM